VKSNIISVLLSLFNPVAFFDRVIQKITFISHNDLIMLMCQFNQPLFIYIYIYIYIYILTIIDTKISMNIRFKLPENLG
jgi:hypothetical protein